MRVSGLVVSYNTRDVLLEALASLQVVPGVETIVVDNASEDGSAAAAAERFPAATVLRSEVNLGFAAGVNRAAREARGEYLLLLNPDARLVPGALDMLIAFMDEHPRAAAVGAALVYADGAHQDSAFDFPGLAQLTLDLFPVPRLAATRLNGRRARGAEPARVDHPLGACMLIRASAWRDVGELDEGYFMYVEEIDWCRRATALGWEIWHHPGAVAVHRGGQSTRQHADVMFAQLWRSRLRYYARFDGPLYNRLVHLLVRIGMRAERRRARSGRASDGRSRAARIVRDLAR